MSLVEQTVASGDVVTSSILFSTDLSGGLIPTLTVPYSPSGPLPPGPALSILIGSDNVATGTESFIYMTNLAGLTTSTQTTTLLPPAPPATSQSGIPAVTPSISTSSQISGIPSSSIASPVASSRTLSSSSGPTVIGTVSEATSKSKDGVSSKTNATSQLSNSTSTGHAQPSTTHSPDHRLANGVVAGIVVAAALALSFATFIATFLVMRRRRSPKVAQKYTRSKPDEKTGAVRETANGKSQLPWQEKSVATKASVLENNLPQSADDKSVQNKTKIVLEQIELHVENFYLNNLALPTSRSSPDTSITFFDSPNLPNPLASSLRQSNSAILLIKHALTHFITSSITSSSRGGSNLLPDEFVLVPAAVELKRGGGATEAGFDQCMSRWRVLTAYLRPTPSQDPGYIAQRDYRINESVERFARAFAPWKNSKYQDDVRNRSLSSILTSAAELGVFLFSQPSKIDFCWPKQSEKGANKIVVAPSLVKFTDEKGIALDEPQVMLKAVIEEI